MKNSALLFIWCFILALGLVSCGSNSEKQNSNSDSTAIIQSNQDQYTGIYKTSDDNLCKMTISISKNGTDYLYNISFGSENYKGKLIIEQQDKDIYCTFDGKIGDNAPKTVGGQFIEGKLVIQNYGNAMNEYHYFKNCDEKYLEFTKQ